jgi:hypothetical protein
MLDSVQFLHELHRELLSGAVKHVCGFGAWRAAASSGDDG